ncbi:hypothetical protein MPNT_70075 [Candidatus Methylacidithermus pantelleriae]|uniref:Uncharacterized protein n=1 Tax=Candidatus Methylacidithermus pantelleriae TaxID=2744239 RepID=A0A8J2BWE9_9BACT|nr:hypothetical protein MPNT_70075 [Candidatus Methylacidithermus pantelleriae]
MFWVCPQAPTLFDRRGFIISNNSWKKGLARKQPIARGKTMGISVQKRVENPSKMA